MEVDRTSREKNKDGDVIRKTVKTPNYTVTLRNMNGVYSFEDYEKSMSTAIQISDIENILDVAEYVAEPVSLTKGLKESELDIEKVIEHDIMDWRDGQVHSTTEKMEVVTSDEFDRGYKVVYDKQDDLISLSRVDIKDGQSNISFLDRDAFMSIYLSFNYIKDNYDIEDGELIDSEYV